MKKIIVLLASAMIAGTLYAGPAFSAGDTCTVKSVQGSTVTLDCGDDAADYSTGMKVTIKKGKKRKALEGC
ncbi:MAG: hypothetical protein Kow0089_07760 [Desulfobulbaceae bacterium]